MPSPFAALEDFLSEVPLHTEVDPRCSMFSFFIFIIQNQTSQSVTPSKPISKAAHNLLPDEGLTMTDVLETYLKLVAKRPPHAHRIAASLHLTEYRSDSASEAKLATPLYPRQTRQHASCTYYYRLPRGICFCGTAPVAIWCATRRVGGFGLRRPL